MESFLFFLNIVFNIDNFPLGLQFICCRESLRHKYTSKTVEAACLKKLMHCLG